MKRVLILFFIYYFLFVKSPPVLAQSSSGDVNGDGSINSADLTLVLSAFGTRVAPHTGPDLNGDGVVNISDLSILLSNFGKIAPTPTTSHSASLHPDFTSVVSVNNRGVPIPTQQVVNLGIPECPAQMHDDTTWHSVYVPPELITPQMKALLPSTDMTKTGCHYDHEHKDNPHILDDVFGSPGQAWQEPGQSISYPWQTFMGANMDYPNPPTLPGRMENEMKHIGYQWLVRKNMDCSKTKTDGCITDMRVQAHSEFSAVGAVTRVHSYWYEARVCLTSNPSKCGIVRNGGWLDYGYLAGELPSASMSKAACLGGANSPDPTFPCIVRLPGMPAESSIYHPTGPKRQHGWVSNLTPSATHKGSAVWYGFNRGTPMFNKIALIIVDIWGNVDVNDPGKLNFVCPDFQCKWNSSTIQLHQFGFLLSKTAWDPKQTGIVNYNGYTDRHGQLKQNCTTPGLDCVPLVINNLPILLVGQGTRTHFTHYEYTDDEHGIAPDTFDHDMSPAARGMGSEWWIEHNMNLHAN